MIVAVRAQGSARGPHLRFTEADPMSVLINDRFESARFGDQRLTNRLVKIVDRLNNRPQLSIPAAMKSRAEMEAAYRFFDNDRVTPEAITAPHVVATQERIRQTGVTLLVQDTTEIDLTRPDEQVDGAGPLDCDKRIGTFYHPLMAFDDHGVALGIVWNKTWIRKKLKKKVSAKKKRERAYQLPIEKKESFRWLEGVRAALATAKTCPQTQCICIADSEADVYELFLEDRRVNDTGKLELLIRSARDRTLNHGGGSVLDAVRSTPCLARCYVDVSKRTHKFNPGKSPRSQPRDARLAEVEVRAMTVPLHPPDRPRHSLPEVTVNVVLVEEINTPQGQIPIQWLLITTLPIDTLEQVELIVRYYTIRWQIEVYFRTLKSGCRIEERYFENLDRLLNCLAVYSMVAWRVLALCRLSRECPDLSCEAVFEPSEWKPVYMAVHRERPPKTPPTLNQMVRMIASLGGYVLRKSTQPGTQTLWIGLQRLHDLALAWDAFGPETRQR